MDYVVMRNDRNENGYVSGLPEVSDAQIPEFKDLWVWPEPLMMLTRLEMGLSDIDPL